MILCPRRADNMLYALPQSNAARFLYTFSEPCYKCHMNLIHECIKINCTFLKTSLINIYGTRHLILSWQQFVAIAPRRLLLRGVFLHPDSKFGGITVYCLR